MNEPDFRRYYYLERYIFEQVSPRFAENGALDAFDFFCIVIWKANRSKSKIARRLLDRKGCTDLDASVRALTSQVAAAPSPKERLRLLIHEWGFRLPMASAILTALYPADFTVYDTRVCNMLHDFQTIQNKSGFEAQWTGYEAFRAAVIGAAPSELSLRDKDRWLWGQSFAKQLETDLANSFQSADAPSEPDA